MKQEKEGWQWRLAGGGGGGGVGERIAEPPVFSHHTVN